jgi:hypothetical protein
MRVFFSSPKNKKEMKLIEGKFLTFTNLTQFNEFLQKPPKNSLSIFKLSLSISQTPNLFLSKVL